MKKKREIILKLLNEALETAGEFYEDDFGDAVYTVEGMESKVAKAAALLKEES